MPGPQLKGRQAKRFLMFGLAILLLLFGLKAVLVRRVYALHVHSTCTCLPCTLHSALRMHVARSHGCRTSAAALPLALHSLSVAGQGDPAGGPGAATRCQVRARVVTQHGHTRRPGSGRAGRPRLEAPSC